MRCLDSNKRTFWYALYRRKTPIVVSTDPDRELRTGTLYDTGERVIEYWPPVECAGNISPAGGTTMVEQFGNSEQYDKVIVMDAQSCPPIDENTVLCVDQAPAYDEDSRLIFDYVVKKVAKSLHHVSIAISKVAVS